MTSSGRVLDPAPDGPAERIADHVGDHRPVVAASAALIGGCLAIIAFMLALGLLLTHVLLDLGVQSWDESISRWLADHRTSALNHLTQGATLIANTEAVVAVVVVATVALLIARRWREALVVAGGLIIEFVAFLTVNTIVDRPRPDVPRLNETPVTSSFPSGHVAASLVLWGCIAIVVMALTTNVVLRVLAWIPVAVLPVSIAFARDYRGMHHTTDVIAGALLGLLALIVACGAGRVWTAADHRRARTHDPELDPLELTGAQR